MLVPNAPPDCAGNAIARELLTTSRRVVRERGEYVPEMVEMARGSVRFATNWLRRCRLCRLARSAGGGPLCGASTVPAGR